MKRFALSVVFLSSLTLASAQAPKAGSKALRFGAPAAITSGRLKTHLEFIADDLLEGRDTPSRGLDIAALYISSQLKLWGVQPAGDNGTYFQNMSMTVPKLDTAKTVLTIGDKTLHATTDFDAFLPAAAATGDVEYVGYGFRAPSKGIDPYAGRDVKGKILLVLAGMPKELPREELFSGKIPDAEFPVDAAQKLGAKAIMILAQPGQFPMMRMGGIPTIILKPSAVTAMLEGTTLSPDELFRRGRQSDPGASSTLAKTVALTISSTNETYTYKNVVGKIAGSDPKLKEEYVAFGAHYDHVGKRGDGPGDTIWNGADDDGSGTVAILEIAHAFATGPRPKRSSLFVWHAGEEKGLWGSDYFVEHPTVPLKNIVTQLNIDMIGRSRAPGDTKPANANLADGNSIYVIGSRKLSDELGDTIVAVNKNMMKLNLDYKYDDPKDPEHFYERSDHYNYARKGIPIAFFFNGVHEDYHGAGDEVSKIDFVRMEKVTRTVYGIGWTVANTIARPKVNKPVQN